MKRGPPPKGRPARGVRTAVELPPTPVVTALAAPTACDGSVDKHDGALFVAQHGFALRALLALGVAQGAPVEPALIVEVRAEVRALASGPLGDHRLALGSGQAERGVAGVGLGIALGGALAQARGGLGGKQGGAPRHGVGAELADASGQLVGREVAGAILVRERLGLGSGLLTDGAERRALGVGQRRALGSVTAIRAGAPTGTAAPGAALDSASATGRSGAVAAASGVGLELGGLLVGEHTGHLGGGGPQVGAVGVGVRRSDGVEGGLLPGVEGEALREPVEAGVEGGGLGGGLGVSGDGHAEAEDESEARAAGEAGEMRQGFGGKE